jgi:hypothetical protein
MNKSHLSSSSSSSNESESSETDKGDTIINEFIHKRKIKTKLQSATRLNKKNKMSPKNIEKPSNDLFLNQQSVEHEFPVFLIKYLLYKILLAII